MVAYSMEYLLAELGSAAPTSPLKFLYIPNLLIGGVMWESEGSLTLCNIENISALSILISAQIQNLTHTSYFEEY